MIKFKEQFFLCFYQLGDFGLARFVTEDSSYSTECVGNLAYCAPEYTESGKVSIKTDVYSFGVVLLQLITGMRTTDKRLGEKGLVGWVRFLIEKSLMHITYTECHFFFLLAVHALLVIAFLIFSYSL